MCFEALDVRRALRANVDDGRAFARCINGVPAFGDLGVAPGEEAVGVNGGEGDVVEAVGFANAFAPVHAVNGVARFEFHDPRGVADVEFVGDFAGVDGAGDVFAFDAEDAACGGCAGGRIFELIAAR